MRGSQEAMVEVKGYPSRTYRDPSRANQPKPTNPVSQAQQWYSHAMLKVMRLRSAHPAAIVMAAFPDFPRYRTLLKETEPALRAIGVAVLFVAETGQVESVGYDGVSVGGQFPADASSTAPISAYMSEQGARAPDRHRRGLWSRWTSGYRRSDPGA